MWPVDFKVSQLTQKRLKREDILKLRGIALSAIPLVRFQVA